MRKGILLILTGSVLLLYSCSDKQAAPAHLIARDKMEDVLWDMMRADLFVNNYMVIKDTALDKKPVELKDMMDSLSRRKDSLPVSKPTKIPMQADSVIKEKLSGKKEE